MSTQTKKQKKKEKKVGIIKTFCKRIVTVVMEHA